MKLPRLDQTAWPRGTSLEEQQRGYALVAELAARVTGVQWNLRGGLLASWMVCFIVGVTTGAGLPAGRVAEGFALFAGSLIGWLLSVSYHQRPESSFKGRATTWVPVVIVKWSKKATGSASLARPGVNPAGLIENFSTAFLFAFCVCWFPFPPVGTAATLIVALDCAIVVAETTVWPGWYNPNVEWPVYAFKLGQYGYPLWAVFYLNTYVFFGPYRLTEVAGFVLVMSLLPLLVLFLQNQFLKGAIGWLERNEQESLAEARRGFVELVHNGFSNRSHALNNAVLALKTQRVQEKTPRNPSGEATHSDSSDADAWRRLALSIEVDVQWIYLQCNYLLQGYGPGGARDDWWDWATKTLEKLADRDQKLITYPQGYHPPDSTLRSEIPQMDRDAIRVFLLDLWQNALLHGGSEISPTVEIKKVLGGGYAYTVKVVDCGSDLSPAALQRLTDETLDGTNLARLRRKAEGRRGTLSVYRDVAARTTTVEARWTTSAIALQRLADADAGSKSREQNPES